MTGPRQSAATALPVVAIGPLPPPVHGEAVTGLSRWTDDRSALARASRAALDRARQCHDEGTRGLENLAALMCSSASLAAPAAMGHEARHER